MKRRGRSGWPFLALFTLPLWLLALAPAGCVSRSALLRTLPEHRRSNPERIELEVTAYCPCGECCGWRRNWLLQPVHASGPLAGQRKRVGVTASGTVAQPGTIAADPALFPFGTVMYVPGYGYGRVEDVGSDIKGRRIDVFFRRHSQALRWGRQRLEVTVWRP